MPARPKASTLTPRSTGPPWATCARCRLRAKGIRSCSKSLSPWKGGPPGLSRGSLDSCSSTSGKVGRASPSPSVWAFLGGMPQHLVVGNLPAGVVGLGPLNPVLTRGFLEYAQHWGFIRSGRTHGTSRRRPMAAFQDEDRHTLVPRYGAPYDTGNWSTARAHPGHHVQCWQALSSVPSTPHPLGQGVEVRLGTSWCAPTTGASWSSPTSISPGEAAPPTPRPPPTSDTPGGSSRQTDFFKVWPRGGWTTPWTAPSGTSWRPVCPSGTTWACTGSTPSSSPTCTIPHPQPAPGVQLRHHRQPAVDHWLSRSDGPIPGNSAPA